MPSIPLVSKTPGMEKFSLKVHGAVTPKAVLTTLNLAFRQAISEETKANSLAYYSLQPLNMDVDASACYFQNELTVWTDAVRRSGISIQD